MPTLADRQVDEAATTRQITRRLIVVYADRHPASHVEDTVAAAHDRLATARVRAFVPIFVERLAREMLGSPHETAVTPAPGPGDTRSAAPPKGRPVLAIVTICLLLFLGSTALLGGIEMIVFSSGDGYLPQRWLAEIPVIDSWLVPGLMLGAGFGIGSLVTAYGLIRRPRWRWAAIAAPLTGRHWSWLATILVGIAMMVWIGLELVFLSDRSWLEAIYGLVGAMLTGLPMSPKVRAYLRSKQR